MTVDERTLLSMPESDYMNAEQLAFFRRCLEDQRDDLLNNFTQTTRHLQETESKPDPVDRATQEEEYAIELRTRDRERKLLHKIEKAMQRINRGEYGYSEETGEPIGLKRLLARPTATLTLEEQERHELHERQFGS
jgi:DnaK suppressor protein